MDPDGLLRAWELDLLLQGCLWFYFTPTPQEGRGRAGAEFGASGEAGSGWLSWFPSICRPDSAKTLILS